MRLISSALKTLANERLDVRKRPHTEVRIKTCSIYRPAHKVVKITGFPRPGQQVQKVREEVCVGA